MWATIGARCLFSRFSVFCDTGSQGVAGLQCRRPWVSSLALHKSGVVAHACDPRKSRKAERSGVQSHPWLHSDFWASLGCERPFIQKKKKKKSVSFSHPVFLSELTEKFKHSHPPLPQPSWYSSKLGLYYTATPFPLPALSNHLDILVFGNVSAVKTWWK